MAGGAEPEEALARLAAGGLRDPGRHAWELFDGAWPALVRWLGTVLRVQRVPRDLAEEAGQAALLRVWRARMDYRGTTSGELLAWMRRIVQREVARAGRRGTRDPVSEEEAPEPASGDVTAGVVLERDARASLEACLDELPAAQREVIDYLYSPGAPAEREVAAILGRSKTRVNDLRRAALRLLESCLRRKGIDG